MGDLFWFGVTYSFYCSKCKRWSQEKMALSATSNNQVHIQQAINSQKLECQLCHAPVIDGTDINVNVVPGTREHLQSLGYPVPPVPGIVHSTNTPQ